MGSQGGMSRLSGSVTGGTDHWWTSLGWELEIKERFEEIGDGRVLVTPHGPSKRLHLRAPSSCESSVY